MRIAARGPAPGQAIFNRGHVLAHLCVGAWLCDSHAGWRFPERVRDNISDQVSGFGSGGKPRVSAAGPGCDGLMSSTQRPSDPLLPANRVSLFWHGVIHANAASYAANPDLAAMYYNPAGIPPYVCYSLHRNSHTNWLVGWNESASLFTWTLTNAMSTSEYGRPLSFAASWSPARVAAFKDGRSLGTTTGLVGNIAYANGNRVTLNNEPSSGMLAQSTSSVVLIFNAALTADQHLLLALNPYGMFTTGRSAGVVAVGGGGGGGAGRSFSSGMVGL